ncbi:hypothetical protein Ciccas_005302 [Cichlidogyrus casuarinus]|uniref:Probable arginine--tRNA ligase, mitochondrial n=1 Tax=Cichlidogyrus casuarinus TaxID=1844966 RepID=A0ABD2Q908_9PLAT
MSTRKGQGIRFDTLLDQTKDEVLKTMDSTATTAVHGDERSKVADQLALSYLYFELLKQPRSSLISLVNFAKNRDRSGMKMQYAHARISSLKSKFGLVTTNDEFLHEQHFPPSLVDSLLGQHSPEQQKLIHSLFSLFEKYPSVISNCHEQIESSFLAAYASNLTSLVNSAWKSLPVLNQQNSDLAKFRLAIFMHSQEILADSLRIFGLEPLHRL